MKLTKELFDPTLSAELITKANEFSTLAKLSTYRPLPFNGQKDFVFSFDKDVDVVAENGAKGVGGIDLAPIVTRPIKIEYGARVSDELLIATKEEKIEILKTFVDGFARKAARGLDLMGLHGLNPRTKQESVVIGNNCFAKVVTQSVTSTDEDGDKQIEEAINAVTNAHGLVTGIALAPAMAQKLAKQKDVHGNKIYRELAWGGNPTVLNGLDCSVNKTVGEDKDQKVLAYVGDFANCFKWGYAKDIAFEVIQYGDPDNSGSDLKGKGQVYLRAELYLGWAIFNKEAFAKVTKQ